MIMMRISYSAQEHFCKLLLSQVDGTQIRVFVTNPGTQSAECNISYCYPDSINSVDIELKFEKFSVYIDKLSAPFLKDAEIDFVTDKLNSQLTIKAPNIRMNKITDSSSLFERVEYKIQTQINPQLASHGGYVTIIEITEDGYAVLQFGGGCNGCSMVNVTLKEGIEKELLSAFPELRGVYDFTEHQRGKHSYY